MKIIINGIIKENTVFVLLLGLCSALAVTTKVETAYIMGLCVLVVLLGSNIIISLIRNLIPHNVQIPVYILITGTFVTIIELLLHEYVPILYAVLGVYLPLIVVNCIVLGRALSFASKNKVTKTMLDSLGIGIGYLLVLTLIGLIREVLGNNTITLMDAVSKLTGYKAIYQVLPNSEIFPITFFNKPAGAFLVLGLLLALFNFLRRKKHEHN